MPTIRSVVSFPCALVALLAVGRAQAPDAVAPPALPPGAPAAITAIRAAELQAHAAWLADDARQGRLTGSPGQQAAADYIAAHFQRLGLEPLGDEGPSGRSFEQRYGITRTTVADRSVLRFGSVELRDGFAVLGGRPLDLDLKGKVRFVGLGRTRGNNAEVGAEESLAGTLPIVLIKPPRSVPKRQLSVEEKFGMSFSTLNGLGRTAKGLARSGAAVVVFAMLEDPHGLSDVLNYVAISPGKDGLAPRFDGGDPGMSGMLAMLGGAGDVPTLILSLPASVRVLTELGLAENAVRAFLDGEPLPATNDVEGAVALAVETDDKATAGNVVALLRGTDPELGNEAIVFSAHMDHVGMRMDGEVFNGADDNASGSAGLLGIATAFAQSAEKPRRSVIFLSVSGEELGLWGSRWFSDHPTWPLEQIVANVNTDMIGRSGPESGPMEVAVTPSHRHAQFSTMVRDAAGFAEQLGMTFTSGDKYYQRSDHYNFARKGIPVVFFCNGEHEDYHQVSDHADKLDSAKMERIARLAFWVGWQVANGDERPRTLGSRKDWK